MLANSHPAHALEQIEKIQKDFLELIGPGAPHMTEKRIDDTMEKAISVNPPGAKRVFEHLRLTPYQDPIYQRELSVCARFVVDSFNYYVPPDGISIATEDMDMIPFSSIHSVALNGLIKHFEYLEGVPIKVPYIFISQHTPQTAWICSFVRGIFQKSIPASDWQKNVGAEKVNVKFDDIEGILLIARESVKAFLCDTPASDAGHFAGVSDDELKFCRLLTSFVLAHEYSHIGLNHGNRFNVETPLNLSSFRLQDLANVLDEMSKRKRTRVPITAHRLTYFFGHQQDELEADLLAFLVLYDAISKQPDAQETLQAFFRAVCYCIMWSEINEAIGRTIKNGAEWAENPIYHPDYARIYDLEERGRYPSAYSRFGYLIERAEYALKPEHFSIFNSEIEEAELIMTLWRRIVIAGASGLFPMMSENNVDAISLKNSFVWNGLPRSMRDSLGYHDYLNTFDVAELKDYGR